MDYLANTIGARVAATDKEVEAASYLKSQLERIGLKPEIQNFTYNRNGVKNSANVIAYKKGISSKEIIVGAHYDSVSTGGSKGVDDNASGVGVLLEVAEQLRYVSTPYSIKFVLFGAEEVGLRGSQYYVSRMSQEEKDNTVLMVNLDSLVAGDIMYAYGSAGDKGFARDLALDIANRKKLDVTTNPGHNPKYPAGTQIPSASDNHYFDVAGIPYLYFEATNWYLGAQDGYTQTEQEGSIWHTGKDNFDSIEKAFPGRIEEHLTTFTTLLREVLITLDDSHIK